MATQKKTATGVEKLTIKKVRLSYVVLDKPTRMKANGEEVGDPTYRVTAMIPKSDKALVKAIKDALQAAEDAGIEQCWNGKKPASKTYYGVNDRLQDGDESEHEEFHGHWMLTAKAQETRKPNLYEGPNKPYEGFDANFEDVFYSGMWAHIIISTWAYNVSGGQGISVSLKGVMKWKDDERFSGGGGVSSDDFGVEDEDDL